MVKSNKRILVVDDEPAIRKTLYDLLTDEGYKVELSPDGIVAMDILEAAYFNLIILDINLPGKDGLEIINEIKIKFPIIPVIIFTAYGTSDRAIEAMKRGAYDYLEKPFDINNFLDIINRALVYEELSRKAILLSSPGDKPDAAMLSEESIIGSSSQMREIFKLIGKTAPTDANILITGESGTGKELIANAIHRHSQRANKAFIKVNCAALPETLLESELFGHERGAYTGAVVQTKGRFELADNGTLFLDEICEISPAVQVKLLRVLQHKSFERIGSSVAIKSNARIIAATNKDIHKEIKLGNFREDLYYRLNVVQINIPPLREHPEDIKNLVLFFMRKLGKGEDYSITPEALEKLYRYHWPGNIRQLENVIKRAIVISQGNILTSEHITFDLYSDSSEDNISAGESENLNLKERLSAVEKSLIEKALITTGWHKSKSARLLGISRRALFTKIKEYGLEDKGDWEPEDNT